MKNNFSKNFWSIVFLGKAWSFDHWIGQDWTSSQIFTSLALQTKKPWDYGRWRWPVEKPFLYKVYRGSLENQKEQMDVFRKKFHSAIWTATLNVTQIQIFTRNESWQPQCDPDSVLHEDRVSAARLYVNSWRGNFNFVSSIWLQSQPTLTPTQMVEQQKEKFKFSTPMTAFNK